MQVEGVVGPRILAPGSMAALRLDRTGAQVITHGHGRFYEAIRSGNVYTVSVAAGNASAFSGGAGGTPLLAAWNPASTGKNLAVLGVGISLQASASGAGQMSFSLWFGPTAAITGTLVGTVNMLTLASAGGVARGVSNAAMTSSTAVTNSLPLGGYYWATAAGAFQAQGFFDIGGLVVVPPGALVALGVETAVAGDTYNAALIWEEIDV